MMLSCTSASVAIIGTNTKPLRIPASKSGLRFCDSKYIQHLFISADTETEYPCKSFNVFDQRVKDIQLMAKMEFKVNVLVHDYPLDAGGVYKSDYNMIRLAFLPNNEQSIIENLDIFSHEIGHKIFEEYLEESFPFLSKLSKIHIYNDKYNSALKDILRIRQNYVECNSKCLGRTEAILHSLPEYILNYEQLLEELTATTEAKEYEKFFEVISPYHELFADIIEVIYTKDPSTSKNSTGLDCRSFNIALTPTFKTEDPHCKLSIVRKSLWDSLLSKQLDQPAPMIKKLAETFLIEIKKQIQQPSRNQIQSLADSLKIRL